MSDFYYVTVDAVIICKTPQDTYKLAHAIHYNKPVCAMITKYWPEVKELNLVGTAPVLSDECALRINLHMTLSDKSYLKVLQRLLTHFQTLIEVNWFDSKEIIDCDHLTDIHITIKDAEE